MALHSLEENTRLRQDLALHNREVVKDHYDFRSIANLARDFIYKELLEDYPALLIDSLSYDLSCLNLPDHEMVANMLGMELSKILEGPKG